MERLGDYELLDVVGEGGMGCVWRARDTKHDRIVALKVISEARAHDEDVVRLFRREAELVGRLNSPHIIPIHAYGEIDGRAYLTMPYVRGESLSTLVRRRGPANLSSALSIIKQAASALDDSHASGVVHRDVKPGNLLVSDKGFVYLADFGISVVEGYVAPAGAQIRGSWGYMAPERFLSGRSQGPQCDIYALGCVMHHALTGHAPYEGTEFAALRAAHEHAPIPSLCGKVAGVSAEVDRAIAWALAKDPSQRPPSAGAWVDAIVRARRASPPAPERLRAPVTSSRSTSGSAVRAPAPERQPTGMLTMGVLVLFAVLLGAVAAVVLNG